MPEAVANSTSPKLNPYKDHTYCIAIAEARKLLGKSGGKLSDNQVQDIVANLQVLARKYWHNSGSKKAQGV